MVTKFLAYGCASLLAGFAIAAHAEDETLSAQFQTLIGNTNAVQEDWSMHAQTTEIYQGYPSFHAPYSGANSLNPEEQWRNTTTGTVFLGRRLWQGAEVYYDPELTEGTGLSNTLGVAGYPNGEASKSGSYQWRLGEARLFVRQVIGLGGPTEKIEAGQNQLASVEDIARITVTVGKLAAPDIFDDNIYSHDSRTQFLNWSLMDSAAWDFPANAHGYTQGAVIDLNQKDWALRYGAFMEPQNPNSSDLAFHGLGNVGQGAELEERYQINKQPGKTHFLVFYNRNRQGYFDDALQSPGDVNAAMDQARGYGHGKYGLAISAEQQLTDSICGFTRLSWNDGKTEEFMFTQIEESAVLGLSMNGKQWQRPDDVWGIAGVVNGISSGQKKFLERGGLGILIGDGQLNYAPEMIFETYYAFKITPYVSISPDYQFVDNPGYNRDRGPVNIFAARLHAEF